MRRLLLDAVPGVMAGVAAHAVTAVLVHAGGFAAVGGVHRVHVPLALLASVVTLVCASRRRRAGRAPSRPVGLVWRTLLVAGYLLVEAVPAEGVGPHLLHDPWVLLAPAGVVLAHLCALTFATALLRLVEVVSAPDGTGSAVGLSRQGIDAGRVSGREPIADVLGRAPPRLRHL